MKREHKSTVNHLKFKAENLQLQLTEKSKQHEAEKKKAWAEFKKLLHEPSYSELYRSCRKQG